MGRSQRHKVIIQSTDSCGKGLSEKQPALRYINQFANSLPFTVSTGPAGGPLQGSTISGFPPTLIPLPGLDAERDGELHAAGAFTDPDQFNLSGNPRYTSLPSSNAPDGGGEPGTAPSIDSLNPVQTPILTPVQVTITGSNFTENCNVLVDGNQVVSALVSATEMTADLPSFPAPAKVVQFTINDTGTGETSNAMTFNIVAGKPGEEGSVTERTLPIGPLLITLIEAVQDGLALTLNEAADIRVGDEAVIEATGNTQVNGTYAVVAVDSGTVVVDNLVDLPAPIEGKGRITVR